MASFLPKTSPLPVDLTSSQFPLHPSSPLPPPPPTTDPIDFTHPYDESIDGISPLLFMDFYKHQMSVMEKLPGLREITGNIPEEFHEAVNEKKKCRLHNRVFESDHYRKIR